MRDGRLPAHRLVLLFLLVFALATLITSVGGSVLLPKQEQTTTTQTITETVTTSTTYETSLTTTYTIINSTSTFTNSTTETTTYMTTETETTTYTTAETQTATGTTTATSTFLETITETSAVAVTATKTVIALGTNLINNLTFFTCIAGFFLGGISALAAWRSFTVGIKRLVYLLGGIGAALVGAAAVVYRLDGLNLGVQLFVWMCAGAVIAFTLVASLVMLVKLWIGATPQ